MKICSCMIRKIIKSEILEIDPIGFDTNFSEQAPQRIQQPPSTIRHPYLCEMWYFKIWILHNSLFSVIVFLVGYWLFRGASCVERPYGGCYHREVFWLFQCVGLGHEGAMYKFWWKSRQVEVHSQLIENVDLAGQKLLWRQNLEHNGNLKCEKFKNRIIKPHRTTFGELMKEVVVFVAGVVLNNLYQI